jgi:hypothetical protein
MAPFAPPGGSVVAARSSSLDARAGDPELVPGATAAAGDAGSLASVPITAPNAPRPSQANDLLDQHALNLGWVMEAEASAGALPQPRQSGLLAVFLPFDSASLERAVDQFLEDFDGLRAELLPLHAPSGLLSVVTALAVAAVASEVIIRRRQSSRAQRDAETQHGEEGFVPFPALLNSWSWGLAES